MFQGLRTVAVHVPDLTSAKAWYAEVLGQQPYFDEPFYVGFDVEGFELGLLPEEGEAVAGPGGAIPYWAVDDVHAAAARLAWLGAHVDRPSEEVGGGIVVAHLRDPWGNRFGLIFNPSFRLSARAAGGGAQEGPIVVVDKGARLGAVPADVADQSIVKEVVVAAPPEEVWPLWTTSDGLKSWLVPDARVELRIGGPYEVYFLQDGPLGARGSEGCNVLSYVPERMLSFTWNSPPHLELTREQRTWVVVELLPEGDGTRVRVTHTGWPATGLAEPESQWPDTFAYFDRAWGGVLRELAASFQGQA